MELILPLFIITKLMAIFVQLRSANETLVHVHVPKSTIKTYNDKPFEIVALTLWNELLLSIRDNTTTANIKNNLKTHLFKLIMFQQ